MCVCVPCGDKNKKYFGLCLSVYVKEVRVEKATQKYL